MKYKVGDKVKIRTDLRTTITKYGTTRSWTRNVYFMRTSCNN